MDWKLVWENYKIVMGANGENVRMSNSYLVNLIILVAWTFVLVEVLVKTIRCNVVVRAIVLKKESNALRGKYYIQYSHEGQNHEMWYLMKKGETLNKDGTLTFRMNPKNPKETFQYIHPIWIGFLILIYGGWLTSILIKIYEAIMMSI